MAMMMMFIGKMYGCGGGGDVKMTQLHGRRVVFVYRSAGREIRKNV